MRFKSVLGVLLVALVVAFSVSAASPPTDVHQDTTMIASTMEMPAVPAIGDTNVSVPIIGAHAILTADLMLPVIHESLGDEGARPTKSAPVGETNHYLMIGQGYRHRGFGAHSLRL